MKKTLALLLASVMALTLLTGCQSSTSSSTPSSTTSSSASESAESSTENTGETYTLEMATGQQATNSMGVAGQWFIDEVYARTDGQVVINYFPGATVGSENDTLVMLAAGEMDFVLAGSTPVDMYCPQFGFITAPFLYESMEHLQNLLDGDLGDQYNAELNKVNIDVLGSTIIGYRQLVTNQDVNSLEDIAGMKLRIPEIPTWQKVWTALGAEPVVVAAAERYNALSTGVVTATEGTWDQNVINSFYEVVEYAVETNHVPESYFLYASSSALEELPEDLQAIVRETAVDAMSYGHDLCMDAVDSALEELAAHDFVPHSIDLEPLREKAFEVYEEYFENDWNITTYEEIMSYAEGD